MRSTWVMVVVIVLAVMACGPAFAGDIGSPAKVTLSFTKDYTASPWTHELGYSNQAVAKLGFGVKNLLLGWTDLFREPYDASQSGKNVAAGIGKGLMDTLGNELGGALHTITFPFPQIDVPLPDGGVQM